jgi:hypothetical protein
MEELRGDGKVGMHVVVVHLEVVIVDGGELLEKEGELDAGLIVLTSFPLEARVAELMVDFVVDHFD